MTTKTEAPERAAFHAMTEGTKEDWAIIGRHSAAHVAGLPERLLAHLRLLEGYYFFHHLGLDRDLRERYRGHEWFDYTAEFCAEYNQPAFDPGYRTHPL